MKKWALPSRHSQAYSILCLIAVSGELPADQISRLPGGSAYKAKIIKDLKQRKLIYTYYRDKLRGYRLTSAAKSLLLADNNKRFAFYLTGNVDTNILKSEITRRLRLKSISETIVTMLNSGASVYRDDKPDIFYPGNSGSVCSLNVTLPTFYNSREIKEVGTDFVKIQGARMVGVLLTQSDIFIVYNTGGSLMKWENKSEIKTKAMMKDVLCLNRLPHQYRPNSVRALMLGESMEQMYQLLTSTGGVKRSYFILNDDFDSFIYFTTDHAGEIGLRLLCDTEKASELNDILSENLYERDPGFVAVNDAMDENGEPVLFAYICDMRRIKKFNYALNHHSLRGTIICFEYQADVLRRYCCEKVRFQIIDFQKFERRFFP